MAARNQYFDGYKTYYKRYNANYITEYVTGAQWFTAIAPRVIYLHFFPRDPVHAALNLPYSVEEVTGLHVGT